MDPVVKASSEFHSLSWRRVKSAFMVEQCSERTLTLVTVLAKDIRAMAVIRRLMVLVKPAPSSFCYYFFMNDGGLRRDEKRKRQTIELDWESPFWCTENLKSFFPPVSSIRLQTTSSHGTAHHSSAGL